MTFRSLALKNIKENWRSYSAFFLSSLFSVAIFYIYYAFLVHPDVLSGKIIGASKVKSGMEFCLYLISIFSFVFILYSSSSFLKSRKKEFGLLSLFGMTNRQLRKLVFIENMLIGLLSTVAGIVVGNIFSKLFLMGLGALLELEQQIRFVIPLKAVLTTIILFVGIFLVITTYTTIRLKQGQIIELLRAHKQPKGELMYSKIKVVIGFSSLIIGYVLAVTMTVYSFIITALPIIALVVVGSFLLYSQLSIIVLQLLKKNKKLFYNRGNMVIISQLGYKIKDNARILSTITILSAVVMTAMGTMYIIQVLGKESTMVGAPYTVAWVETEGETNANQLERASLIDMLNKHDQTIKAEATIEGIRFASYAINAPINMEQLSEHRTAMIISQSKFKELEPKATSYELTDEDAVILQSYLIGNKTDVGKKLSGLIGSEVVDFTIADQLQNNVMNSVTGWSIMMVVVSDTRYDQLAHMEAAQLFTMNGIEFGDFKSSLPLLNELQAYASDKQITAIDYSRNLYYADFVQSTSLTIFIGLFICLLFFIAAGSLIYFKLFTERDEDIEVFKGLSRIGMTYKEMKKIVSTQVAIIFFLPCIVGIIHAWFAMFALQGLLQQTVWHYAFVVFGIYVLMQAIYFVITSKSYLNSIKKGSITSTN